MNEGGDFPRIPPAALTETPVNAAYQERITAVDAAIAEATARDTTGGETTVEWALRSPAAGVWFPDLTNDTTTQDWRQARAMRPQDALVRRERTRYPDRVTDWQEVPADD